MGDEDEDEMRRRAIRHKKTEPFLGFTIKGDIVDLLM